MHVYTSSRDLAVSIVRGGSYRHCRSVSIATALFLRNQAVQPACAWLKIIPYSAIMVFTLFTTFHDPHNYVHGTGSRVMRVTRLPVSRTNHALGRSASALAVNIW